MSFVFFQTMCMVCCVMYLSTNCWRLVPQAQALTTYLLLTSNTRNLWAKTWCLCVPLCRSSIEITRVEHNWYREGAGCDGILCEKLEVQYFNKKLSPAPPELRIKHPIKMNDIHTYNRYPSAYFGILEFIRCSTFIAVVNIVNIMQYRNAIYRKSTLILSGNGQWLRTVNAIKLPRNNYVWRCSIQQFWLVPALWLVTRSV